MANNSNKSTALTFDGRCYRLSSFKQLIAVIFASNFQMFSPTVTDILMDFSHGRAFQPSVNYKRATISAITSFICHRGYCGPFTFVYENTIPLCISAPQNSTILAALLGSFDLQLALPKINRTANPSIQHLIRLDINPVLKYRFPRNNSSYKRMFCGKLHNYISGVNVARYACNDFYHVIAFDCCSQVDFSQATFISEEKHVLQPQELAINNEYANPESAASNALFAGKFIIVAQKEDSGIGLVKTDSLYPLIEKCLMSSSQPINIDMPQIAYSAEGQNDLMPMINIYKTLGISNTPLFSGDNSIHFSDFTTPEQSANSKPLLPYYAKTTLNFTGDGFYRLPIGIKSTLPSRILINEPFLLIYIDEKNNPILSVVIN